MSTYDTTMLGGLEQWPAPQPGDLGFVCPVCRSGNLFFVVNLIVQAPIAFYRSLNKSALRKREVEVLGVEWPDRLVVCRDCGWNDDPRK